MDVTQRPCLEELSWSDVRKTVLKVNPRITEIIDDLSPGKNFKLVKSAYRFGDLIAQNGKLNLSPLENPISSKNVSLYQRVVKKLTYSPIPLSLLLNKSSEVFIGSHAEVTPLNILNPGNFFGIFEALNNVFESSVSPPIWNVSAGAHSTFTLASLGDTAGLKKLKASHNISLLHPVKSFSDHQKIFTDITRHPSFPGDWESLVLFFTDDWLNKKRLRDTAWANFKEYFFQVGWQQAQYAIERMRLTVIWRRLSKSFASRNIKPPLHLSDTLKHLFSIALGHVPGFRPVEDEEELLLPAKNLQKVLIESYNLKEYSPTIMLPYLLQRGEKLTCYYSLSHSTLLEGAIKRKLTTTIMSQLKELKGLIDFTYANIKKDEFLENLTFQYFHVEDDKEAEILSSKIIPNLDPSFQPLDERLFCYNSNFWRGCIRICLNT